MATVRKLTGTPANCSTLRSCSNFSSYCDFTNYSNFTNYSISPGLTVLLLATLLLSSCKSITTTDTTFPYVFDQAVYAEAPIKQLMIADVNFGAPSKHYLREHSTKLDTAVVRALEAAGYTVMPNDAFRTAWRQAVRRYGHPYHPDTSQLNPAAFQRVMVATLKALREQGEVDAVVFTDLIERSVSFGAGSKRAAYWDGVSRKVRLKGTARTITEGFDWSQTVPAISLSVTIYRTSGEHVFKSVGGLEVSREIDTRTGNGRFVRREKILKKSRYIEEGTALALHPFVEMDRYPGER